MINTSYTWCFTGVHLILDMFWSLFYFWLIIYCILCYFHVQLVSTSCSSRSFLISFIIVFSRFLSWLLGIYSWRYYSVFLCFANWSFLLFLLKSLPKLQPEQSLRLQHFWFTISTIDICKILLYLSIALETRNYYYLWILCCTYSSWLEYYRSLYQQKLYRKTLSKYMQTY